MKILKHLILLTLAAMMFSPAVSAESVTKSISAENQWSEALTPAVSYSDKTRSDYGFLNLSISGTWEGTVTLQMAFDSGSDWISTGETFDSPAAKIITCYEQGVSFRVGIAAGDYTSGTVNVRLSK